MSEKRFSVVALLIYLGISFLVFTPNLTRFSDAAIGDPHSDALKHVWGQWWVHRHLTVQHHFPLEMDLANFPDRGRFYCLDSVNAALTVFLRPFMNPVTAYNLLYLLHLALAAFTAFLLARELTKRRDAAFIAGVIFGFSPYVLSFPVGSGVAETAFLFPLPMVVLYGLRTINQPHWRNPVFTALWLLLQGIATWSYGIYGALFLFFLAVAFLITKLLQRRGKAKDTYFSEIALDRPLLLRAALFIGILLLAALPAFFVVQGTVSGDEVMYQRHLNIFPGPGPSPLEEPSLTSFAWIDFFLPGTSGRRADMYTDKLLYVAYAGFSALIATGFALFRRRKGAVLFGGIVLAFFLFALGPIFFTSHSRQSAPLINPFYLVFYYVFPLFNATLHSVDRFAVAFQLALAVTAAMGFAWLQSLLPNRLQRWFPAGVTLILLFEYLVLSPAPWPIPMSPAPASRSSIELQQDGGDSAVLDLPPYFGGTGFFIGDIFFQQTIHARPIPYNLEGVSETVRANPFYSYAEALSLNGRLPPIPSCEHLSALKTLGFEVIVFRPDRMENKSREALVLLLENCLGEGRRAGQAVLYSIR